MTVAKTDKLKIKEMEKTAVVIGIILLIIAMAVIVYNNIISSRSKKAKNLSASEYLKKNAEKQEGTRGDDGYVGVRETPEKSKEVKERQ